MYLKNHRKIPVKVIHWMSMTSPANPRWCSFGCWWGRSLRSYRNLCVHSHGLRCVFMMGQVVSQHC